MALVSGTGYDTGVNLSPLRGRLFPSGHSESLLSCADGDLDDVWCFDFIRSTQATVTINGVSCPLNNTAVYSHTYMECILPRGEYKNLPLIVTVGGQSSAAFLYNYSQPIIQAISPGRGTVLLRH